MRRAFQIKGRLGQTCRLPSVSIELSDVNGMVVDTNFTVNRIFAVVLCLLLLRKGQFEHFPLAL